MPQRFEPAGVGYWLRYRSGARLVSGWAFGHQHVERLSLTTGPANEPSQRVAERAAYKREGLVRAWMLTPVGRRDAVMFSLLPGDLTE